MKSKTNPVGEARLERVPKAAAQERTAATVPAGLQGLLPRQNGLGLIGGAHPKPVRPRRPRHRAG